MALYQGLTVDETEQVMLHINLPDLIHVGTVERKWIEVPGMLSLTKFVIYNRIINLQLGAKLHRTFFLT
jgi:hypothetical protein